MDSSLSETFKDSILIKSYSPILKLELNDFDELRKFLIDELRVDSKKILIYATDSNIKDILNTFQKTGGDDFGFIFENKNIKFIPPEIIFEKLPKIFFLIDMRFKENEFLTFAERLALCNSQVQIGYYYSKMSSEINTSKFHIWLQGKTIIKKCNIKELAKPRKILFFGDSLVISFSWIFTEKLKDYYLLEYDNFGKVSSGLVVSKFYNWEIELGKILSVNKYDLAILFIGANDDKGISIQDIFFPFGSREWKILYAAKVKAILSQLLEKKIVPIIVTLPTVQSKLLNEKYTIINEIFRSIAENYGFKILDLSKFLGDGKGSFVSQLPFRDKLTLMRVEDGVHFTKKGAELMSQRLLELIFK